MCKPILAAGLTALVVSNCGSGDLPMTPTEFCQSLSQRECANVALACYVPEVECKAVRQQQCADWVQGEEGLQRQFDSANAEACLSRVSAVFGLLKQNLAIDASNFRSIDTACERVFHGSARANDVCLVNADCSGTLKCDKGRCGSLRQVDPGAGCANIGEYCPQGYYCGSASGVWMCTARPGPGAECTPEVPCVENLRCDNGTCADRLALALACQADGECASAFCEPFVMKCGTGVRFAEESSACLAYQPSVAVPVGQDASTD
ncbi:MAG TPA: hypothetical protein VJ801_16660 [Polyangia bacterium]|jgi:hypothetical protein|nr:hypothetical protein [Polyangia bacterium]